MHVNKQVPRGETMVALGRSTVDTPVNMRDCATAGSLPVGRRPTTACILRVALRCSSPVHDRSVTDARSSRDVCRPDQYIRRGRGPVSGIIVIAHLTPAFSDDRPTLPPRVGRHLKAQDRNVKDYVADGGR